MHFDGCFKCTNTPYPADAMPVTLTSCESTAEFEGVVDLTIHAAVPVEVNDAKQRKSFKFGRQKYDKLPFPTEIHFSVRREINHSVCML